MSMLTTGAVGFLLVLGDSVSVGAGASRPARSYAQLLVHNDDVAYPEFRGCDLATREGRAPQVLNWARSGATAMDTLVHLRERLHSAPKPISEAPAWVVMTVGGNDLKNAFVGALMQQDLAGARLRAVDQAEKTTATLTDIVALLRDPKVFPGGVHVVVANVYDPSGGQKVVQTPYGPMRLPAMAQAMTHWRDAYRAWGQQQHVIVVDAHTAFTPYAYRHAGRTSQHQDVAAPSWFADLLHPNDAGHDGLRRLFWRAFQTAPASAL